MSASVLKNCPFCGSDELSHGWDRPGWDGRWQTGNVQCSNCDAFTLQDTEAEAITAWNTRTDPERDALRAIAQRILDRGYVSACIDEEREDHNELVAALAKGDAA